MNGVPISIDSIIADITIDADNGVIWNPELYRKQLEKLVESIRAESNTGYTGADVTGHPEHVCHGCGGKNPVWSADNELWNKVIGSPNGILCPTCFVILANQKGVEVFGLNVPGEEGVDERAQAYADKVCPYVWPLNKDGERIEQRVGQRAPGSGKHRRQQEVIKAAYIAGALSVRQQDRVTESEFINFTKESRVAFCKIILQQPWNVELRTAVDSFLVCFDQMAEILTRPQSTPTPPGIVEQLRAANPWCEDKGAQNRNLLRSGVWNECCDTLATLLSVDDKEMEPFKNPLKTEYNMHGFKVPKDCPSGFYCNHPKCYCTLSEEYKNKLLTDDMGNDPL
jgi:hypothetical protein